MKIPNFSQFNKSNTAEKVFTLDMSEYDFIKYTARSKLFNFNITRDKCIRLKIYGVFNLK